MKVSYSWLKDYVDVKLDPERLASLLTMAGVNTVSCEKVEGEYIFEFEITSNRPDCLSVLGIAREIAACVGKKLKVPRELQNTAKTRKTPQKREKNTAKARKEREGANDDFDIEIKDTDLCPRYTARIIRDVEIKPSPDWLKDRIICAGLRPVNNIVDITNFVLLETGQPMHAFDLDKLRGAISVRCVKRGEALITIDNVQRRCDPDALVIADREGPVAIAGIMGGLKAEVSRLTKNILLESAFFDPISVRKTSRALGITSESSYRFERRINNDMVLRSSERAANLIRAIAGGSSAGFWDVGGKTSYSKTINLDLKKTDLLLGASIGKKRAAKILKALGFSVKTAKKSIKVTVPAFREDVKGEVDLTEEIARIYGYEKIPFTIPHIVGNTVIKEKTGLLQEKISRILARLGLLEIITYGLINKDNLKGFDIPEDRIIPVRNPLSIDQEIMRPSLAPGMLKVISYNLNRRAEGFSLFEMGKTYKEKSGKYEETRNLAIGFSGVKRRDWKIDGEEFDFFDVKGILEKLLAELGINGATFKKSRTPAFEENASVAVEHNGETIAAVGEIKREIADRFDIEKKVFYGELYIEKILGKTDLDRKYVRIGKYPSIKRDISIMLDRHIASSEVTDIIRETGKRLVKEISLIDCYKGKQIPTDKQGLLYRIEYNSRERTLEDAEVDKLHAEVKSALSAKLAISFR